MKLRENTPSFKAVIRIDGPKHNVKKILPPLIDEVKKINKKYPQPLLENSKASPERQSLFKNLITALKEYSISRFSKKNVNYIKLGKESCKLKSESTLRRNSDLIINAKNSDFAMINGFRFKYENVKPKQIIFDAQAISDMSAKPHK